MKKFIIVFFILIQSFYIKGFAQEYSYILNDKCINALVNRAESYFNNTEIQSIRDSRGIILRFEIKNPFEQYNYLSNDVYYNSLKIKEFLSKIENPVIIEVHTENVSQSNTRFLKNWELSTVIANNIESVMLEQSDRDFRNRINSIGYGEFLPSKNTSNNGGKYANRVDIIILCNISGE